MKRKDSLARKGMKVLCVLLGITFGVMLAITLLFRQALDQIRFIPSQSAEDSSVLAVFSGVSLGFSDTEKIGGPHSNLVNILLIGQDAREGETQARSDSMILCTYNKASRQLTMTSFLRDLYVPIPGHGSNRLNAAYAFGGTQLLKKTIDQNFCIAIDGSIEVDFTHFAEIIDQLGGVEIELRQDEANLINQETGSELSEGLQWLDGFQTLTYSRIRSLDIDGDVSRTNRQRKVMSALIDTLRGIRLTEMTPVIGKILPRITTDLSRGQLCLYALEIVPQLSDIHIRSQRIPADGTFTDKTIDGMSVLVADLDTQRQYLRETLLENG